MTEDLSNNNSQRDVLSSSTLRRLITDDTAQWARSIYAEKKAISDAINIQRTQNQSKQTIGAIAEFGGQASGDVSVLLAPSISAGASSAPVEFAGGEGGDCQGVRLYLSENTIRVGAGNIAGYPPAEWGANPENGLFIASLPSSGYAYVEVIIEEDYGKILELSVKEGSIVPESQGDRFYFTIGYWNNTNVVPYGCGDINLQICRNWYASSSPFFGATFFR